MVPFRSSIARHLCRHWALVVAGALFLLAGALVFDDYGVSVDLDAQRLIGKATLDYLAGDGESAYGQLANKHDRYYGAIFEAPLIVVERVLGLEDHSWDVYRSRHLLTHLFFLAGAGFCYLLVLRMFGSRALALVVVALFLLHPRLYAHSFFNSKDIPFLVAFTVSLYLVHRAFRRETLGAFLLCGVGVGLLVNLRIMGLALFVAVLVLRGLDVAFARGREERGRVLLTGGAFALAAMLTYYGSLPALWPNPVGHFAELVETLGSHPSGIDNLFRGVRLYPWDGPPFDYVPVWVGITTPPATLLLASAGAVALVWRGVLRPRDALRNGPLRFGLLLIVLPVATVAAVVALGNNLYDHWRQLYYLCAPLLLLAATGLHWLAGAPRGRWVRPGSYALAGAAIAVAVVAVVRIHPQQDNYFSALTDRATPERLASRYYVVLSDHSQRIAVERLLAAQPSGSLFISRLIPAYLLPADGFERLVRTRDFRSGERNFFFLHAASGRCPTEAHIVRVYVYANTLRCVVDPVAYFGAVRREVLAREPVVRARYDVYRDGRELTWVWDGCPAEEVGEGFESFVLHVYPRDAGDLSPRRKRQEHDFENLDWVPEHSAVRIDGNCMAVALLPDYPVARVRTGQVDRWSAEVPLDYAGALRDALAGEPLARGDFAIYQDGRTLTYLREGCTDEEAARPFFLHLHAENDGDLPDARREHGFDNLDTVLTGNVGRVGGNCVAIVDLPAYPIASVRTGQSDATGERWAVEFAWPE